MNLASLFYYQDILLYISFIPLIGIFLLIFINPEQQKLMKFVAINFSSIPFILFLFVWGGFKKSVGTFQFVTKLLWIPVLNLNVTLGIDGISLFFLLLTTLLIPLCLLISWNSITSNLKGYLISFLLIEFFLIGVFCVLDLLMFYILFESILIPMFLVVGIWGSRERKMLAAYYFFLYTLLGSVLMLLSILYIYTQVGSTDYEILLTFVFSDFEQKILWFTFFLAFAAKVPMMPVHLWLPEAHVEAPTAGSVILAAVLLKMGTYGFIRFSLPLLPDATLKAVGWIGVLAIVAIVYGALVAMAQKDMKKLVAYSSVSHMGFVMLGMFALNEAGLRGSILQMLNHGVSTGALFLLVGIVYERRHNRLISEYGGLAKVMPLYAMFFMIITMSSIGLPTLNGFIGEFTILIGAFHHSWVWALVGASGIVLGAAYMLWLYQRVFFGELSNEKNKELPDLNRREQWTLIPLVV